MQSAVEMYFFLNRMAVRRAEPDAPYRNGFAVSLNSLPFVGKDQFRERRYNAKVNFKKGRLIWFLFDTIN